MSLDNSMWHEKHKPTSFDDFVFECLADMDKQALLNMQYADELPRMLFFGPCGTGKSTIAKLLTNDKSRYSVHYINCASFHPDAAYRLTNTLAMSTLDGTKHVVIMDEIDTLPKATQLALRSVLDRANWAPFIATCNFRRNVIEPLQSRFVQFELRSPTDPQVRSRFEAGIVKRLRSILQVEGITGVDDPQLASIASQTFPDIRQAISIAQARFGHLSKLNVQTAHEQD